MEKEEAIEQLKYAKDDTKYGSLKAALSMAIEALEQREKPKEGMVCCGRCLEGSDECGKDNYIPRNNSNGDVKTAEEILPNHISYDELHPDFIKAIFKAMHEYHNQFPSVKQSPYLKMSMSKEDSDVVDKIDGIIFDLPDKLKLWELIDEYAKQSKSPYPKMNQPTIDDIQNTLYNCAKITQSDDGITMERLFKKEAEAILELFSKDI